jgi:hypothetical protein
MEVTPYNFKRIVKDERLPPRNPMECEIFTTVKDKGQGCTTQVRRKSTGHAWRDPCTRLQRRGTCDREGPGVQSRLDNGSV